MAVLVQRSLSSTYVHRGTHDIAVAVVSDFVSHQVSWCDFHKGGWVGKNALLNDEKRYRKNKQTKMACHEKSLMPTIDVECVVLLGN